MEGKKISELKKNKKKIAGIVLLIVIGIILWSTFGQNMFKENSVTATGTIEASTVKVTASVPGVLESINFNEGDTVKTNDVIAKIRREDIAALVAMNEAALTKAKYGLAQVSSSTELQQMKSAQAMAGAGNATFVKAEQDYNRIKALYNQGATSLTELERYQTAYKVSQDNYASAQAQVNVLKSKGGVSAQVGSAQADVDRAQASLDGAKFQLSDLTLTAPIDGVLTSRNFEPGEYVGAGLAIATITDLENLWIKVYVTTTELPGIKLGQTVHFTVSGYKDQFEGKITFISDKGEYTPKTVLTVNERANVVFAVKIQTGSNGGVLKPGIPADVIF